MSSKINLPNVTLLSFAWGEPKYLTLLLKAYNYFSNAFRFGEVTFLVCPSLSDASQIPKNASLQTIPEDFNMNKYNDFCIKSLYTHFDTDFVMLFQYDGFIVNPHNWSDTFLNYDYIGAPWGYKDNENVGNGGFSIRSKKLQTVLGTDPQIDLKLCANVNEDEFICRKIGKYLKAKHHIQFAPEEVAQSFSIESGNYNPSCLGIHGQDAFFNYILYEHSRKKRE
jgi:hypothetical protein